METGCLGAMFAGGHEKSTEFGTGYADVAKRQGCDYLNAADFISSSAVDGIHWDAEAHQVLGNIVADRIDAIGTGV